MTLNFKKNQVSTWVVLLLLFILILRIGFSFLMGLMPQDAYYYLYSENLALSYFDHPPMIAYLLAVGTGIIGKSEIAIKLTDLFTTLITLYLFYNLSRSFLSEKRTLYAFILLSSSLMISILSLVSTPDVPLLLFWTLSLLLLYEAIFMNRKIFWLVSGISMGLAMDSKYTAIVLPAGMLLFLFLSKEYRKYLSSVWPWLCILLCIVFFLPVIIWNYQYDFASFRFQSSSRMNSMNEFTFHIKFLLGTISHQAAILLPIFFIALFYYIVKYLKKYKLNFLNISSHNLFLLSFFIPLFIGFFGISIFYWVKINWMMPAYLTGTIWLSQYLSLKWIRVNLIFSVIIHILAAIEILFYPIPVKSDDTWFGWKELSTQVNKLKEIYPNTFIFSADDYKTSAILNFYQKEKVYGKNIIGQAALQFDIIDKNTDHLKTLDAIFIDSDPQLKTQPNHPPPHQIKTYFDSVEIIEPITIYNGSNPVRKFNIYYCKNYKGRIL